MTVLATIPLAVYAFRQKAVADTARSEAEHDRDLAKLRGDELEAQLLTTKRLLEFNYETIKTLQKYAPKEAQRLTAELAPTGKEVDQALASLREERERLRRDATTRCSRHRE